MFMCFVNNLLWVHFGGSVHMIKLMLWFYVTALVNTCLAIKLHDFPLFYGFCCWDFNIQMMCHQGFYFVETIVFVFFFGKLKLKY